MVEVRPALTAPLGAGLRVEELAVRYSGGGDLTLRNVSFTVAPQEFCVLVGPSGCGKSTLLRTINRMVEIDGGRIFLDDENIAGRDPVALRREIGYVIQAGGLFPHYSVAENVGLVPTLLGWDKATIAARVDELLQLVRLEPARYAGRRPRELSGGEMQRVGVARALAARPRLLLMDEPFGALDPLVRETLQRELVGDIRRLGTTTIFVTHDIDEALVLADRIILLRDGAIEQQGTPLELLQTPASVFVRQFVRADDRVRQLRITSIRRRHAQRPLLPQASPELGERHSVRFDDALYDALNVFLANPELSSVAVFDEERYVGELFLNDIIMPAGIA